MATFGHQLISHQTHIRRCLLYKHGQTQLLINFYIFFVCLYLCTWASIEFCYTFHLFIFVKKLILFLTRRFSCSRSMLGAHIYVGSLFQRDAMLSCLLTARERLNNISLDSCKRYARVSKSWMKTFVVGVNCANKNWIAECMDLGRWLIGECEKGYTKGCLCLGALQSTQAVAANNLVRNAAICSIFDCNLFGLVYQLKCANAYYSGFEYNFSRSCGHYVRFWPQLALLVESKDESAE